jgi:hypothetical protein
VTIQGKIVLYGLEVIGFKGFLYTYHTTIQVKSNLMRTMQRYIDFIGYVMFYVVMGIHLRSPILVFSNLYGRMEIAASYGALGLQRKSACMVTCMVGRSK